MLKKKAKDKDESESNKIGAFEEIDKQLDLLKSVENSDIDQKENQSSDKYNFDFEKYNKLKDDGNSAHTLPTENNKKMFLRVIIITLCVMCTLTIFYGAYQIIGFDSINNNESSNNSQNETNTPEVLINKLSEKDLLHTQSLSIPDVAKTVKPSVVGVVKYEKSKSFGPAAIGSGVILTSDGYIVTNYNIIERADKLKVVLDNGKEYTAEKVGHDSLTDIAVIKINEKNLIPANFGDSKQLEIGEWVLAIGNLTGESKTNSVNLGIVSALDMPITNQVGISVGCIQTDAEINEGNSGGALVNMHGQVVGINASKIKPVDYKGVNFAISVSEAKGVIDSIIKYGYVKGRVKMGIAVRPIDQIMASVYNVSKGVCITEISKESDAMKKGLREGDIILTIDEKDVSNNNDINEILYSHKPGDIIKVTYQSGYMYGEQKISTANITLSENRP